MVWGELVIHGICFKKKNKVEKKGNGWTDNGGERKTRIRQFKKGEEDMNSD